MRRGSFAILIVLCTGCSDVGGSSSSTPASPTQPQSVIQSQGSSRALSDRDALTALSFAAPAAAVKGAIIVSDQTAGDVDVFNSAGMQTATIAGFQKPQSVATDSRGNIYVADEGASSIAVYKNDDVTLLRTLADPGEFPTGVTVSTTYVVGVANFSTTSGAAGSVMIFPKDRTTPCRTVKDAKWAHMDFVASGGAGALYIVGTAANSGNTLVGIVANGCNTHGITTLTVANTLVAPGGVAVSTAGDIAIDDPGTASIYTYGPPVNNSLGKPIRTTALTGARDVVSFAFTQSGKHIWTADSGLAEAVEYEYPAGGAPIATISGFTTPAGIAVTPVAIP